MQIGFGYDVHKLVRKRKLIIGGVQIAYEKGLLGWSDGDVLIHAIIDALLGAMGAGDIGQLFPAGDKKYKGISSLKLLANVAELLKKSGFAINNIDATVVAEEPRLAPYIAEMKQQLADCLGIAGQLVNIKGKTEEGLGFTGTKKGIAAYAICLLHKEIKCG
ncbi:2-C-methyl-D-erythritol 2,4-cyclodiphosphate synthase [Candidatus Saganbacteria bacterium CG08_land_8_20_14_0_20_45_16]|uniref:2-C-methyl-D-erythritol 2,4-cyclodiphosphate synthase n=1 Tax=Candidatus Saganbacteria bacterium CG08_land_8_20_14_0_20_45_16 TaxID=2014293 RepID=A0A2H0XZJ0_UNCSA|nr:MAG: 2-C-methyl-D-erythritol 2,4-cyclodiphosphate synthase [Candidatus Saganbacteria bacterium CG08_land_8_20_14_0_20_45_16]